jgi:hypothetical protein
MWCSAITIAHRNGTKVLPSEVIEAMSKNSGSWPTMITAVPRGRNWFLISMTPSSVVGQEQHHCANADHERLVHPWGEVVAHHGQGEQAESTKRQPPRDPLDPSRLPSTTDHERTERPGHENRHPDPAVADIHRHRIRPVEQRSSYARSRYGPGSGERRVQVFLAVGGRRAWLARAVGQPRCQPR